MLQLLFCLYSLGDKIIKFINTHKKTFLITYVYKQLFVFPVVVALGTKNIYCISVSVSGAENRVERAENRLELSGAER